MKISYNSPEYYQALYIRRQVFVLEQEVPEDLEIDEFESFCDHFLLKINFVPAATGRLRVKDKFIKFERIATLETFRGQGMGKLLMIEMMTYVKDHYTHLKPYMHAQLEAVPFYEKMGWKTIGEIFLEADIPHQAMVLS